MLYLILTEKLSRVKILKTVYVSKQIGGVGTFMFSLRRQWGKSNVGGVENWRPFMKRKEVVILNRKTLTGALP